MISETDNPIDLFHRWFADAEKSEPNDPSAMALATTTPDGAPSVRMVLLKGVDDRGFVFYTNLTSRKGRELAANPRAALCFHWKSLTRQVRVEGPVVPVADEEADAYYASRAKLSQIGAWASKQSQVLEGRFELEKRIAKYTAKFNVGEVPRPEFWSGFRLTPRSIEFWQQESFRLHDRLVYKREQDDAPWATVRLFP
ncbi:MAG: pyridoxamine 5'-phosphate oxidase [Rhodospirillales bacterium]